MSRLCSLLSLWSLALSVGFPATASERTNPFVLPALGTQVSADKHGSTSPTYSVKAVMPHATAGIANINGQLVRQGEKLDQYVLNAVHANGIELSQSGRVFFIPLAQLTQESVDAP